MKPKKLLSLLLSLALVVGMIPAFTVPAAAAPKYNVIVENGIADNVTTEEENITQADHLDHIYITHNNPPAGMVFDHWELVEGEIFAFEQKKKDYSLAFQMPAQDIHVRAVYVEATELVDTVVLTGGKPPKVGESASYPITGIKCLTSDVTINTNQSDLCWIYYSPANSPTFLNQGAPFDSETEYYLEVNLRLNPTMGKAWADKVQVTLDGKPAIESKTHTVGDGFFLRTMFIFGKPVSETPHTITVDDGTADKSTAKAGETVAISAKEKENFTFTGWTAYTDDARSVSFADRLSPNTTFIMPDCDVRIMPNYKYSGSVFTDFYVYITPPAPGQHPQAPTVKTDDYSVSAYNWVRITDSESKKMTASDVFEEGVFYQCRVDLLVKDGIVGEADELKGYVNGSTKTDGMDVITSRNSSFKVKVVGSYKCSAAKANPFVDVTESDYFFEPVLWAVEKGITKGTDDTHFSPNATCTRGQVVTFLWRAAGSPAPSSTTNPFADVNSSDYYYNAVLWAVGKNITKGTSSTTFGPNDGCTRGQVVTFLHRFENTPTPASSTNPFVDVSSSEYYYTPVLWAVGKGITNGTDATHFSPNDTCTRGQIVTFLYRDMK